MNRRNVLKLGALCLMPALPLIASAESASGLSYQVFTATRLGLNRDIPPGKESLMWVANSSTLISGKSDAVLVDTFLTIAQNEELADKIASTGKTLRTIYVTHAHGDHFLGLKVLLNRFPDAKALATPEAVASMRIQTAPETFDGMWRKLFPGQVPDVIAICDPMEGDTIELEGEKLSVVRVGHTDTDNSTCLHVPSIGLVVAGDAVYNGIHPYLSESTRRDQLQWIAALDKIDALNPKFVVAGHKVPTQDDSPRNIEETRRYIRDFIRLDESTTSARELYDQMLTLYPDRANPGSLWSAARAAKTQSK